MSIFLTRPVINTEEERNAKADILELPGLECKWKHMIYTTR